MDLFFTLGEWCLQSAMWFCEIFFCWLSCWKRRSDWFGKRQAFGTLRPTLLGPFTPSVSVSFDPAIKLGMGPIPYTGYQCWCSVWIGPYSICYTKELSQFSFRVAYVLNFLPGESKACFKIIAITEILISVNGGWKFVLLQYSFKIKAQCFDLYLVGRIKYKDEKCVWYKTWQE